MDKIIKDKEKAYQIIMILMLILPLIFFSFNPISQDEIGDIFNNEKIIFGNITDINQYTTGSLFSTSTTWVIEIDNATIIKSREFNEPYLLSVGDYVRVTLYNHSFSENYASNIELLGDA